MDPSSAMDIDSSTNSIIITNLKSELAVYLLTLMLWIQVMMLVMVGKTMKTLPIWSPATWKDDVKYYYCMASVTK